MTQPDSARYQRDYSWSEENRPYNIELIKFLFKTSNVVAITNKSENKRGIDFRANYVTKIEVKNYKPVDGLIKLETWSVKPLTKYDQRGVYGWTRDMRKESDHIIFTWGSEPDRPFRIYKYKPLRMQFIKNYEEWTSLFPPYEQDNGKWISECIDVPVEFLDSILK